MKKYTLYDAYESRTLPGEMICTSDSMEEIRMAISQWCDDTDGECDLYVLTKLTRAWED